MPVDGTGHHQSGHLLIGSFHLHCYSVILPERPVSNKNPGILWQVIG